ncbi:MAG: hypothetical protein ACRCWH_13325, partial [Aeromonas veronii]
GRCGGPLSFQCMVTHDGATPWNESLPDTIKSESFDSPNLRVSGILTRSEKTINTNENQFH